MSFEKHQPYPSPPPTQEQQYPGPIPVHVVNESVGNNDWARDLFRVAGMFIGLGGAFVLWAMPSVLAIETVFQQLFYAVLLLIVVISLKV